MSEKIIELLKSIETLNTEDLEKVGAWVDFNLQKRGNTNFLVLYLTANHDAQLKVEQLLKESKQILER